MFEETGYEATIKREDLQKETDVVYVRGLKIKRRTSRVNVFTP
ncbi:hypothetical protein ACMGD3_13340 [Lysinibacillus sphaericus]